MASLLAADAAASPVDLFGYGARGQALAGSVFGSARGHEAVYYNPAALGFDTTRTFTLGFQLGTYDLQLEGAEREVRDAPALNIGFNVPIPFGGWLEDRITLGLAFVLPTTSVLIADIPRPGDINFVVLENRAQTVSLQGGLGFRPLDWLSVGAGFLALSELEGAIDVAPNDAGSIGSKVRDQLIAAYSWCVGLQLEPHEMVSFGATWRSSSSATFELPITVDLGETFPLPIPELQIIGIAQFDPAQASFGVHVQPWEFVGADLAVVWKEWSAFDNPIQYTAVPEGFPPQPPPEFTDTVSVRLGFEGTFTPHEDWRVEPRLGLAYEPSPAPEQRRFHNYLDNDRTVVGIGVGLRWSALLLNLGGQFHLLRGRTSTKDNDISEDNAGHPSLTHGGQVYLFGMDVGFEL